MTTSKLALFGLTWALSSCAVNLCDKDPSDPRCEQNPILPDTLQVMPTRIANTGTHITVRLGTGAGTVVLKQGGKQLSLGSLSDGFLEVHVTTAMLQQANISLGATQIVVSRPTKADSTQTISVFAEPQFDPAISYDTQPDGEIPEGVAIKPTGGIWGFTSFPRGGGRAQHFVEYQISSGQLISRGPAFGNYNFAAWTDHPARTVFQGKRLVTFSRDLFSGSDAIQLDLCGLNPDLCSPLSVTPDFTKVLGLTTDVKGTMLAVQSDQDVYVYQSSDSSPIDRRQNIMGTSSRAGQKIALGDINGDGRIDLVTVSDQGGSVFLGQAGGGLSYDSTMSGKLTGALAGSVPTALTAADMDADGSDDLIVASGTSLQILYPLPGGAFTVSSALPGLDGADTISVGPVDGKSNSGPDIAISSEKAQRIAVIINQSSY
ncbi:MAG TPA: VCBS repeat-containing protein [Pseudomonadota bacterium]|nr:VCBS repeat-containing protein [Pseudomonadota bacterium]